MGIRGALRESVVGREAELYALQTAWGQARTGEGKLVLVSGGYGVSKTCLLETLRVQIESEGGQIVSGQCVEGSGVAYRPWREVLRKLVPQVEEASEAVMKQVGPVLATLLPELQERSYMASVERPAVLDTNAELMRLNDAIVQVLRMAASARPTVVVIKDGHWAGETTLILVDYLARVLRDARVMVCVIYCDDGIAPDHRLAVLAGDHVQRVPMSPLPRETVADLVRSELGMDELPVMLVERVWQVTGGDAFFVRELVHFLIKDGKVLRQAVSGWQLDEGAFAEMTLPEDIRQLAHYRFKRLSEETRQMLEWATVIGPTFWDGALVEIGRVPMERVEAALNEGLEQGLIVERTVSTLEGEREYAFAGSVARRLCSESAPQEGRQKLHGQIATWLAARGEGEVGQHLGLIADHFERAGEREQAIEYLRRAGEQAAVQFAGAEAASCFSRALRLLEEDERVERYDLLWMREQVYEAQGALEAQWQDLLALQTLAEEMGDDLQRAEVTLRRAAYANKVNDYPTAIAAAQEVVTFARAIEDVMSEAAGTIEWARALWQQGDFEQAYQRLRQALSLAQSVGKRRVEADCLCNLGAVLRHLGDYASAGDYYEQALHIIREIGDRQTEARTLNNLGLLFQGMGNYTESKVCLERALSIYREIGDRKGESVLLVNLGILFHQMGDDEAGQESSQWALVMAQELDERRVEAYAWTNLGRALVGLGHLEKAAKSYQRALTLRQELGQHNLMIESQAGLVRVSLAEGNLRRALDQTEEILSYLKGHTLEGTQEPFRVRLTCYHALRANRDPRAEAVLNTAHRLLQEHATRITDEELRRLFLEKVVVHKEILNRVEGGKDVESAVVYVADQEAEREDEHKPKEQLVEDLAKMRRRAAMLEAAQERYRQIEETLWQSEKRFRSIAETAGDVIVIFNAKEMVLFWNKAAQDIFGYWASEVKGKLLTAILTEEFQQVFRREMRQVVATGISDLVGKAIEVTAVRKDGSEFPLELSLIAWRTKGEVFFTIIGNDITERKQAREALEQAYAEVERRVEERTVELQQEVAERGRLQQEIIEAQKHTLQELSTPIIPVMEGIIIVPLIGSMDSMRTRDVTRGLLAGIREHRAKVVIVDITGVPVVDSGVADHLNKMIQVARLKGARTIVTGISEAVAETVVDLGIDWGGIETLSDLQTGLRAALTGMRQRVVG